MKAVFVESYNGYMARNDKDDMKWTPSLDKKIFKLLTFALGGVCVCSEKTYKLLPPKILNDGRKFVVAGRTQFNSLSALNKKYPDAVLVGGPTFLRAAYRLGVIDTFIVTTVYDEIKSTEEYKNPFTEILTKPVCSVALDGMAVRIYKGKQR